MLKQPNNIKFLLCRMAEDDIIHNIEYGDEYTGFGELIDLIPRNHISENGIAYDIDDFSECGHITQFIEDVKSEPVPKLDITCGSFFSRNEQLQKTVSRQLNSLTENNIPVSVYAGGQDVRNFLEDSISFKVYDRKVTRIPHFMMTNERFLLELPHTEKNQVRVDIISNTFDQQIKNKILDYLGKFILGLNKV
jgi:hypothetical protein